MHAVAVRPQWGGPRSGGWPGCGVGTRPGRHPPHGVGCSSGPAGGMRERGGTALRLFSARRGTLRKALKCRPRLGRRSIDSGRTLSSIGVRPGITSPSCAVKSHLECIGHGAAFRFGCNNSAISPRPDAPRRCSRFVHPARRPAVLLLTACCRRFVGLAAPQVAGICGWGHPLDVFCSQETGGATPVGGPVPAPRLAGYHGWSYATCRPSNNAAAE